MRSEELGGLRVRITGGTDREGGGDGPVVVLLHGFGAPGDDLVSLWRVLRAPAGTRFVFPEAPLSLAAMGMFEGRAWWMIDMARLQRSTTARDVEKLMNEVPPGLPSARDKIVAMLGDIDRVLRPRSLVLGGFSQGSMLALDVALHTDRPVAGLVLMSSAFIAEPEWGPRFPNRRGLPVVQSHGQEDPILPFGVAERLRDRMTSAGLDVTWLPFRGGHAIPAPVVDAVGAFLEKHLA